MPSQEENESFEQLRIKFGARAEEFHKIMVSSYEEIIKELKMEHFESSVKVIEGIDIGNKKIEIQFLPKAQKTIIDFLQQRFRQMWDDIDMLLSMINLEYSKSESKGDEKKWRPMGRTAEEQVRPIVSKKLLEVRKILQKQIDSQTRIIGQLFHEVDFNRRVIKHQIEEMDNVVDMITKSAEDMGTTTRNIKTFFDVSAPAKN